MPNKPGVREISEAVAGDDAPGLPDFSLTSGTPQAPSAAPWVVKEEPVQSTRQVGIRSESNTKRPGSIAHSNFLPVTNYIWDDEPCMHYREMDLLDPTWKEYRRYRVVVVVRNDALAEYIEEIGPSNKIPGGPVNLVGGDLTGKDIVETFASMKEIADGWRAQHMPMPHQRYEMKAFDKKKDIDLKRKVI